jgi:hypothetical protein
MMVRACIVTLALCIVLLLGHVLLAYAGDASALLNAGYNLARWTVDGGGSSSSGGGYSIIGTSGQPDAGALNGSSYTLKGGFWGAGPHSAQVFLPLIVR